MTTSFSAVDPALGCLYQVHLALLWSLRRARSGTDLVVKAALSPPRRSRCLFAFVLLPRVATMHRVKGLDFTHVIAEWPGDAGGTPDPRDQSLLYVAATRCRKTLTVMHEVG